MNPSARPTVLLPLLGALRHAATWCVALAVATSAPLYAAGAAAAPVVEPVQPRVWRCTFHSDALNRPMAFLVVLPPDARPGRESGPALPAMYLLHGRGRNETTLLQDAFCRRVLLASRCAIVLPRGLDGWYVDSPVIPADRYGRYTDEVIATAEREFPLRRDGSGRAIAGWSMGGYGAAYTFCRRPRDFAALATIIGIIDYPRAPIEPAAENYPLQPRFGTDPAVWRTLNPRLLLATAPRRPLLVAYATEAPDRQMNEAFIAEARRLGYPVRTLCLPGGHVFAVVREALPEVVGFLELQLLPPPVMPPPPRTDPQH